MPRHTWLSQPIVSLFHQLRLQISMPKTYSEDRMQTPAPQNTKAFVFLIVRYPAVISKATAMRSGKYPVTVCPNCIVNEAQV